MLIGGMIAHAAAEPLPAFARKNLFGPLGITDYCWTLTPVGQPMTDGSFYIRPRDFLKLGQLYLDGGVWHGRRVVSKSWVAESTRSHWPMERPESKGVRLDYGYQWRSRHLQPGVNPRFYYYLAAGGGAQLLVVFAKLDLVIVFTGGRYGTTVGERQHSALLNTFIVRSLGL